MTSTRRRGKFVRRPDPPFQAQAIDFYQRRRAGEKGLPRICYQCGDEVQPPKQNWCSPACVEARLATDPNRQRRAVFRRDRGVCAKCGRDCSKRCPKVGRQPWDADHIVPLVEGGANDIGNLRTLCIPCHKGETRKLARRRAAARSSA